MNDTNNIFWIYCVLLAVAVLSIIIASKIMPIRDKNKQEEEIAPRVTYSHESLNVKSDILLEISNWLLDKAEENAAKRGSKQVEESDMRLAASVLLIKIGREKL